jgi:psiF repeat
LLRCLSGKEIVMRNAIALLALAGLLATGSVALAQGKAAPTRSAASLECSKQADAKGLHGKARKSFRSKCLRSMKRSKSA